jgi:quinol monooxygenase YgiN
MIDRRAMLAASAAFAAAGNAAVQGATPMYGTIGRMKAVSGKRAELAAILLEGTDKMPGCLSYIVAEDMTDVDALWITEVWVSKQAHADSLKLAMVRDAIRRGRPLIAGFDSNAETLPLGGVGLTKR